MITVEEAKREIDTYIRFAKRHERDRDVEFGEHLLKILAGASKVSTAMENELRLLYATSEATRHCGVPLPTYIYGDDPPPSWDNMIRELEDGGTNE